MSIARRIDQNLSNFRSVSLEEVQKASLMRRKDCKFLFNYVHLPSVLDQLTDEYRVLEINGIRSHNYQTFYFDTLDLDMYHMHHRGRVNRHKIRFRKYGTSDKIYLEVKKKDARGITIKNRILSESDDASILDREEEFLGVYTPYGEKQILPVLENSFNRITLVNNELTERITMDYHLWFSSLAFDSSMELPGISIAEIKYEKLLSSTPFHSTLRRAHITPSRFSKYCIGMSMLNPELKQNLFKEKVRRVRKINSEYLQSIKN
jgi:hypothetical protein